MDESRDGGTVGRGMGYGFGGAFGGVFGCFAAFAILSIVTVSSCIWMASTAIDGVSQARQQARERAAREAPPVAAVDDEPAAGGAPAVHAPQQPDPAAVEAARPAAPAVVVLKCS
jgi:hypothetical protein